MSTAAVVVLVGATKLAPADPQTIDAVPRRCAVATDASYEATRAGIIHLAREHYERNGHLEFIHSETGLRTLKDEFDKVAAHNEEHLKQIEAALA